MTSGLRVGIHLPSRLTRGPSSSSCTPLLHSTHKLVQSLVEEEKLTGDPKMSIFPCLEEGQPPDTTTLSLELGPILWKRQTWKEKA